MKFIRFGQPGAEKPGLVDASGTWRDLSGVVADMAGSTLGQDSMRRLAALGIEHAGLALFATALATATR